jgi:fatty acid synthase subunit beta
LFLLLSFFNSTHSFSSYGQLRARRHRAAFRHWQDALAAKAPFVRVKHDPPYLPADEQKVLLNPLARAQYSKEAKTWRFAASKGAAAAAASAAAAAASSAVKIAATATTPPTSTPTTPRASKETETSKGSGGAAGGGGGMRRTLSHTALTHLEVTLRELQHGLRDPTVDRGLGVDAQLISEIEVSTSNSDFVTRNFTPAEIAYCRAAADPSSSFAGRWAAKEAVIKAISSSDTAEHSRNLWAGGSAPLRDIEVLSSASGAPKVVLHGVCKEVATLLGISSIKVSISHSGEYAIAQAIAR